MPNTTDDAARDFLRVASRPSRRFVVLPEGEVPDGVLTWETSAEKRSRLRAWRQAIFRKFGEQSRVLRVAWMLVEHFRADGYCDATDAYIADWTNIARNKIVETLTLLDSEGAICRVHRLNGSKARRHIYAS